MTNDNNIDVIDRILILNLFDISENKKIEDKGLNNNKQNIKLIMDKE